VRGMAAVGSRKGIAYVTSNGCTYAGLRAQAVNNHSPRGYSPQAQKYPGLAHGCSGLTGGDGRGVAGCTTNRHESPLPLHEVMDRRP